MSLAKTLIQKEIERQERPLIHGKERLKELKKNAKSDKESGILIKYYEKRISESEKAIKELEKDLKKL